MRMKPSLVWLVALVVALIPGRPIMAAKPPVPDLTHGGKRDKMHDWTLGPTGARGWIWGWDLETTDARQILITTVEKGSPADGVLETGDVILGVNGKPFDNDARKAFGRAITDAEKMENKGILKLLRWRAGAQAEVAIQLAVMGSYRDTAPYDCPKSRLILEKACRYLAEKKLGRDIVGEVNALGLLASGKPEFMEKVKALAHEVGPADLTLKLRSGMYAWEWGYDNLFLTEYYLATGDTYVLPAIREYSKTIATGQSAVGTWGHGMALPPDGGRLGGYGAINQSGLVCWLSMVLAQKCEAQDTVVRRAIDRSREFFSFYIGKGSIPYGDHPAWLENHDNNGKNALVAVAFDLLNEPGATRYFSRMSTASYDEREYGHTGNYFSYLWGAPGVARSGPEAVAAHLKEQWWYFDLARRWDGGFVYQGGAGADDSYTDWDMTGVFLLAYALPLQKLYITGKGVHKANELAGAELAAVIEDGRGYRYWRASECYVSKGPEELLRCLARWSPVVRFRAAVALARTQGDFVPQLVGMLGSENRHARYGACQTLEKMGTRAAPAVDALIELLSHKDMWLQIRASYALAGIGAPARKAVPMLLNLALAEDKDDPRGMVRRYLCLALFVNGYAENAPQRGLLADSLDGVDRKLLFPAIRRMLRVEDGLARSYLASVYDRLSEAELDQLWPDILRAVEKPALSGEMFENEIRVAGLRLLAKHHIKEGMRICVEYARNQNPWASESRTGDIMAALKSYGAAAREVMPALRELLAYCRDEQDFPDDCKRRKIAAVEDAIKSIEAATDSPPLRALAREVDSGKAAD
jgi:hypothetical protein